MGSEIEDNSWAAERKFILGKIDDFTNNQEKLFTLHHTLSTSVTVISTKLGVMVFGVSTVVSVVVGLIVAFASKSFGG